MSDMKSDAQSIVDAIKDLHEVVYRNVIDPETGGEAPIMFRPADMVGYDPKPLLDQWLERPRRLVGMAFAETLASFCALVNRHKHIDTVVFGSIAKQSLVAVIDYHAKGALDSGSTPSFCGHRVAYSFPISPELTAWKDAATWRGQNAFAQLLDLRRFELIDPLDVETIEEGTLLHDVLLRSVDRAKRLDLHAAKNNVFASPGSLMRLVESLTGSSRKTFAEVQVDRFGGMRAIVEKESKVQGDETIPSLFLVQVSAFVGGDKLVLPARIRAKVDASGLQLCAELVGVDRVLGAAFDAATKEVEASTGCPVFRGSPET